jgi:hypothetical protein
MADSLSYSKALPPSFADQKVLNGFTVKEFTGADAAKVYKEEFGLLPGETPEFGVAPPSAAGEQVGWTFITSPKEISWSVANASNRVEIFGTNNPPVTAGTKGMQELTLNDSLVEGFVRKVTVGKKIAALEDLLRYTLNGSDGFVSVPVYEIWANSRSYGGGSGSAGYFIFKDIKVNEKLRDLKGDTTRAIVDVSFMQVPAYQVNTGRDQATAATAGQTSKLLPREAPKPSPTTATTTANNQVDRQANNVNGTNRAGPQSASTNGAGGQPDAFTTSAKGKRQVLVRNPQTGKLENIVIP